MFTVDHSKCIRNRTYRNWDWIIVSWYMFQVLKPMDFAYYYHYPRVDGVAKEYGNIQPQIFLIISLRNVNKIKALFNRWLNRQIFRAVSLHCVTVTQTWQPEHFIVQWWQEVKVMLTQGHRHHRHNKCLFLIITLANYNCLLISLIFIYKWYISKTNIQEKNVASPRVFFNLPIPLLKPSRAIQSK